MKRSIVNSLLFVLVIALVVILISCNSTSDFLTNKRVMAIASNDNQELAAQIDQLENRIEQLEEGLDPRVTEYNMVKSAIWEMIIDNESIYELINSDNPYTNDMTRFPSPAMPLYGFDRDKDGIPDTNYIPFKTTAWFYQANFDYPEFVIQGIDPDLIESWNPGTAKTQQEVYETELHNIQTAVMAAMADGGVGTINTPGLFDSSHDVTVAPGINVGDYIVGGNAGVICSYAIAADGTVTQVWTPDMD